MAMTKDKIKKKLSEFGWSCVSVRFQYLRRREEKNDGMVKCLYNNEGEDNGCLYRQFVAYYMCYLVCGLYFHFLIESIQKS